MRRCRHGRRGAAIVELAVCIPLIAVIIAMVFFLGFAMTNHQRVRLSARYTVWRDLYGWYEISDPPGRVLNRDEALNMIFFNYKADPVSIDGPHAMQPQTISDLVAAAGQMGAWPEEFADRTVAQSFPHGSCVKVSAKFPTTVKAWEDFTGAISSRHCRDGVEWRRSQVSYLQAIRDQFLADLDAAVMAVDDAGLRNSIQALYLEHW